MFNSDHSEERANYEKCCSLASSHNLIMGRDGRGVSDITVLVSVQRSNTKQKLNNANKVPRWFFRYVGTKTFAFSSKN